MSQIHMSQNPILTRCGVCTSAKRLNMKLLRPCYNLAVCFVPFERTKKGDSADKTQQFIRQIEAIQPTTAAIQPTTAAVQSTNRNDSADNRSGSTDEKGISTKPQLQTITMQFPSHVGEGQGWGQ